MRKALSALFTLAFIGSAVAQQINGGGGGGGGGGSGTVTSVATSCGAAGGTITTSGTIRGAVSDSTVSATTYSLVDGDCGLVKRSTNAASTTITAGACSGFTNASTWFTTIKSDGAAGVIISPSGVTIDGSSSNITLITGKSIDLYCDGTNYHTLPGNSVVSFSVAGTSALGTSPISSASCATVVTTAATGVVTTDVVTASFNGDPTAVTGYVPLTTGMLTIIAYPTANNVNFKVCNNTGSSITPGAITLNWRVVR